MKNRDGSNAHQKKPNLPMQRRLPLRRTSDARSSLHCEALARIPPSVLRRRRRSVERFRGFFGVGKSRPMSRLPQLPKFRPFYSIDHTE